VVKTATEEVQRIFMKPLSETLVKKSLRIVADMVVVEWIDSGRKYMLYSITSSARAVAWAKW